MLINNKKRLAFKSGFTLIELIVVLGILGIVLAMAYSIGAFGNKAFNNGFAKSDSQSNISLAANYITKELRYSNNITILATAPSINDMDATKEYIYIDSSDGILKHHSGVKTDSISFVASNNISAALQFTQQDYQTLHFELNGSYKNEEYTIDSSVLLLNDGITGISGVASGSAVSYSPGQSEAIDINKPVTNITISGPTTVSTSGGLYTITKVVSPVDASVQSVTWSIDPSSAGASIDQNGLLTVQSNIAAGTQFIIKALPNDGSSIKSNSLTVTTATTAVSKKVTSIVVNSYNNLTSISKKTILQMSVDILPVDADNKGINWSISSGSEATINASTGVLTPNTNGNGQVTVKATANDGSGIYGISKPINITTH